ncbi:DNA helicase [Gammaproteobacteria bacterium 42_54_T18]|nr:DNA helicase [Gammaproteobacteria bacterium 42_54_T18]
MELESERNKLLKIREELIHQVSTQNVQEEIALLDISVNQKVELFKSLFKGRPDVFANRWENLKGRSGYSVSCHNEWVPGVCNKPRIKCNECPNRKYKSLNERVIYDHLAGKQVVGLYPLLGDNTCHLLAADFDKNGWQDAVKAMAQACLQFEIPHAVEISRSGNGAHLWVFFSEPVLARDARLLGFGLLDKAMDIHPNLSFEAYDRLFPNQDLMPEGGFGNLIALPLQYKARKLGNSQFVDCNLTPYPDQWRFLSQVKKISTKQLGDFIGQLTPKSQQAVDSLPPWEQGLKINPTQISNCPMQIVITLANHIYIKIDALPPQLIARLKRLASFSNPIFFKTQALRFSTHGIPRYITCARIEQGYLSLPRGCLDEAATLFEEQDIAVDIDDKRQLGQKLSSLKFLGKLRKDQAKAVRAMSKHNTGVLHAPTAFGKTVAAIGLISKRKTNTLILTHSRQLIEQWQERLQFFLSGAEIGIIGGGKKKPTGQIDIATYQSLISKKDTYSGTGGVNPLIQDYGQIIIDECHHISAPSFERVLNEVRSAFVLGLTATPDRQDGHQKIIFMLAGPIRHKVKANHAESFEQHVVVNQLSHEAPNSLANPETRPRISDVYSWLANDKLRTQRILDDIATAVAKGKNPLVLTERREHAELINKELIKSGFQTVILRGGMRAKERTAANEQLSDTQIIVATGKYVGEGFDLPRLDTLFLALPIAWKGSLAQYAGRIHRESEGKDQVTIFDYVDSSLPMLERMFRKREKGYKAMGYQLAYSARCDSIK